MIWWVKILFICQYVSLSAALKSAWRLRAVQEFKKVSLVLKAALWDLLLFYIVIGIGWSL